MSYLGTKRRRDLWRGKWQFGAVLVTIFLGVLLYASSWDSYNNLDDSYNGTYERLAFADTTVSGAEAGFEDDAADVGGVADVATRLQADVPFDVDDHVLIGRLVGMPADEQPTVNRIDITEGSYLDPDDLDAVVIETHMASTFELEPGDTLEVFDGVEWREVEVAGIAISPEYLFPAKSQNEFFNAPDQFGVVFAHEELLEDLPPPAVVEQTLVVYEEDADVEATDDAVREAAETAGADDVMTQADQPSNRGLYLDVQGFAQMAVLFPIIFLGAAALATYLIMTRIVYMQRSQIGTLMANGLSRGAVWRHYVGYGVLLGLIGAGLGVALGIPLGYAMTGMYTEALGIPDTVTSFYPSTIVVGLLFGLAAGFIAAALPAGVAFRISPAEAMRGEVPTGRGQVSWIERTLPFLKRLPTRWRMALRDIGRSKRRSLSTMLAVVLALMLLLVSWGMVDTFAILLERQFEEIALQDADIVATQTVDDELVGTVADVDGVETAESVLVLEASAKKDDTYGTVLFGFDEDTQMHGFRIVDGEEEYGELPEDGILAGQHLGEEIGVEVGDEVTISIPSLDTRFETTLEGFVQEAAGTILYMEKGALTDALADASTPVDEEMLAAPSITTMMAIFEGGADRDAVVEDVRDLDEVGLVTDSRGLYLTVQDYVAFFYAFVGMMLLFGGVMAFALIFNPMSVTLAERSGEFATMRANGVSRGTITSIFLGENLILTTLAIPIGLLLGYWLAAYAMSTYSSDLLSFDLEVRTSTYVFAALSMYLITVVSALPGIRAVGRMDIGQVVRERSQ